MSQITADAFHDGQGHAHAGPASFPEMRAENINMPAGSGKAAAGLLTVIGLVGIAVTAGAGFAMPNMAKHALAAYHVGVMACLGISLGGLFLTLVTHLMGAGWSVTIRRQMENLAAQVPVCLLLLVPTFAIEIFTGGKLFAWMGDAFAGEHVLQEKAPYLNIGFFLARAVVYSVVWVSLVRILRGYSLKQDQTGDKWLTNRARRTSSWGMLAFALTTAFAGFDWLMTLDFRFFSTMWGVYFFAGGAFSAVAMLILMLSRIKAKGRLQGLVTEEHYHDLGKLLFTFTVFWAYISFSQYFLIWYSNIPEETAWFLARKGGGWEKLFFFLCIGHFVAPFLILLFRGVKKSLTLLPLVAAWAIFIHILDIFFIVRPMVYPGQRDAIGMPGLWVDAAGIIGVLALWASFLVRRVCAGVLVPTRDPRIAEAIHHRNYV
ncbi:MAG: hypothetical protein IT436_07755 [Phycisphaerales bacterium]|nr:hypothetical protein [Phycisphaerales bacterium]